MSACLSSSTFSSAGSVAGSNLDRCEVGDVDAERFERVFGQILLAQADQRDVEPRRVEARNHPREQPLDAVHARSFPAEVIADVDDVETSRTHRGRNNSDSRDYSTGRPARAGLLINSVDGLTAAVGRFRLALPNSIRGQAPSLPLLRRTVALAYPTDNRNAPATGLFVSGMTMKSTQPHLFRAAVLFARRLRGIEEHDAVEPIGCRTDCRDRDQRAENARARQRRKSRSTSSR